MNELFPPQFLAAIERLSLDVAAAPANVNPGSHLSRASGSSLDFRDFAQYSPGDDLRRVDWNVYRRTGHLFLRRFEHPTTSPVHVLLDTSESMFVEDPPRYATAARVAAAAAAAALREHDGVSIVPFSAEPAAPLNRLTHRRRLPEALGYLSSQRPGGAGSFHAAADAMLRAGRRNGVAIVVSDFFDDAGIEDVVAALGTLPHRLVLVQITQPWDADPQLDGEAELIDCESSPTTTVLPGTETLQRYRQAYQLYQAGLEAFASRRVALHVKIDASRDTLGQLERLFPAGILRVAGVRR